MKTEIKTIRGCLIGTEVSGSAPLRNGTMCDFTAEVALVGPVFFTSAVAEGGHPTAILPGLDTECEAEARRLAAPIFSQYQNSPK